MLRTKSVRNLYPIHNFFSLRGFSASTKFRSFEEDAVSFERTVLKRQSARSFIEKDVPHDVLQHILGLTQRSPSGYNLQPWVAIVINDPEKKNKLHEVCLSQKKVLEAPISVIFAANHNVLENVDEVVRMEYESGNWNKEYAERTKRLATTFLQTGPCHTLQVAKYIFTSILSYIKPITQAPVNIKAYTWKSAMMAAMTFMLAASSHNLSTHAMEGFDERRLKQLVGLPSHYSIPVVICLGYSDEKENTSSRLPTDHVYRENDFEVPMQDINSFNNKK
ncbi:NADH dehydrogenase nox [Acrasis kona]|uniref:NADH dehydrogenase nox n=1 Tax=Acrasis kona TaxID=1008807 RepID=A0AAW2YSE8_9EUKA